MPTNLLARRKLEAFLRCLDGGNLSPMLLLLFRGGVAPGLDVDGWLLENAEKD